MLAGLGGTACGDDDGSTIAAPTPSADATIDVAPLPPVRPTTTVSSDSSDSSDSSGATDTTSPSATTDADPPASSTPTTAPATTTTSPVAPTSTRPPAPPAAGPCELTRIVTETGAVYDGITPDGLRCAGVWATWIGRPDDQFADGFFAVAFWNGAAWVLANLGTAGVCEGAGVPAELWTRLGCVE